MTHEKNKKRRDALKKKSHRGIGTFRARWWGRNTTAHRIDYFRFVVGGGMGCKPGMK